MMSNLKYLLLILVMMFASHSAIATIVYPPTGLEQYKSTIFAHTGQDPAPRSIGGDYYIRFVDDDISVTDITVKRDLNKIFTIMYIQAFDWKTFIHSPNDDFSVDDFQPNNWTLTTPTTHRDFIGSNGGTVPAPPVFLLFCVGMTALQKRRTP